MLTIVAILGIVLAVLHRGRAPLACRFALVSLAVLAVSSLTHGLAESAVYGLFGARPQGGLWVSRGLRVIELVWGLVNAGATAGLVAAVFFDRGLVFDRQSPFGRLSDSSK